MVICFVIMATLSHSYDSTMDMEETMVKRIATSSRMVIAAILLTLASPLMSSGEELGHDWYCPDHEGHASYVKHLKLHLDHDSGTIADKLEKVYGDPFAGQRTKTRQDDRHPQ